MIVHKTREEALDRLTKAFKAGFLCQCAHDMRVQLPDDECWCFLYEDSMKHTDNPHLFCDGSQEQITNFKFIELIDKVNKYYDNI